MQNDTDTLRYVKLELYIHRHYQWLAYSLCAYDKRRRARLVPTPRPLPALPRARRRRARLNEEAEMPPKMVACSKEIARKALPRGRKSARQCVCGLTAGKQWV